MLTLVANALLSQPQPEPVQPQAHPAGDMANNMMNGMPNPMMNNPMFNGMQQQMQQAQQMGLMPNADNMKNMMPPWMNQQQQPGMMGGTMGGMMGGMMGMMGMMSGMGHHAPVEECLLLPEAGISRGARGPGVAQLQRALISLGLMDEAAVRWGVGMYGPYTTQTIAQLQQGAGNEPTGEFDSEVRSHLLGLLGGSEPSAPAADVQESAPEHEKEESTPVEEVAPEQVAQQAEADERTAMLMAMGFSEEDVASALAATQGSLERAADWLFVSRSEAEPEVFPEVPEVPEVPQPEVFPEEWQEVLDDLQEMGFLEDAAKQALKEFNGDLKEAVKALVKGERGE